MYHFLTAGAETGSVVSLFITMGIMIGMLYFMIYRPQKKQEKRILRIKSSRPHVRRNPSFHRIEKLPWITGFPILCIFMT